MAVPSILMVAPNGTVNEAIEFLTPIFFVVVSRVIGNVALLLEVENAKMAVSRIFFKKINGKFVIFFQRKG